MSEPAPRIEQVETSASANSSWPVLILMMVLTITPMIVISQVAAHLRFDVVDDQMFGYFGWRIAEGATVYVDVWDNKPPGIYWINALGFLLTPDSYAGVVVMCAVAVIATHALFFLIASSIYFRGTAALATILASFFMLDFYFQGGTNRTETFLIPFELTAVLLYMRGSLRDRWWVWLLAGVFCGLAFLCKQVGLAAWGAMGLHTIVLVVLRDLQWRRGLNRCLLLLGGVLLAVGAASAVLAAQGAFEGALFAVFSFNRAYFASGDSSLVDTFLNRHMLKQHMFPALRLPVLMAIAALIHALVWWVRPRFRPAEIEQPLRAFRQACPRPLLLFTIWWLVALYGASVSPHHFRHYLLPSIPPLLLIAGYLINVLKTEVGLVRRLANRGWVVAAFVAMGYFALDGARQQFGWAARIWIDRDPRRVDGKWVMKKARWELVADGVMRHSEPGETLQCWGYQPGVYLHARRPNATRFITTEKVGQVKQHADMIADELRATLEATPPAVFVIGGADFAAYIDPEPYDSVSDLDRWVGGFLQANYQQVEEVLEDNQIVFRRKDLVSGSDEGRELDE